MSRSDLTRGGSTEAMSASWKVSEEVGVFLVAVRAGKMDVDNARAYLGIDARQAEVLLELTANDPLERRQVVRIIARRRLTLKAFERELAYANSVGSGVEGDQRGLRPEPIDSRSDGDPAEAGLGLSEQAPEDGDDRDCGVVAVGLSESQEIEGHTGAEGAAVKEVA